MKRRVYLALSGFFMVFVLYLFIDFARDTENYIQEAYRADAIVVLTGGKGRARVGLNLLRKGSAGLLIISGVNRDADLDSIFLNQISGPERVNIILEKRSRSTYENAVEVRRLMEERGLKSMLLITSVYHMKRAAYVFSKVMPPEIKVATYSVKTTSFDEKKWWFGNSLAILTVEFIKYYWYVIRFSLSHFTLARAR